ncbi:MAG: nucleotidyltransferase family protein [Chlorobiaceae bacterium]
MSMNKGNTLALSEDTSRLLAILSGAAETFGTPDDQEWTRLIDLAMKNGVSQMLFTALKRMGIAAPAPHAERLRSLHLASAVNNTKRIHELDKILQALEAASITVIPVKGAWLSEAIYDNIALRGMADIDLWIQRYDIDTAKSVLAALGYSINDKQQNRPQALHDALIGETSLFKQESPIVELHWRIFHGEWLRHTARIDDALILQRTLPLKSEYVRQLSCEDAIIHIAVHLAVNHYMSMSGLRALLDLNAVRKKLNVKWPLVARRAKEWQVATPVWLVLTMLDQLFVDPDHTLPLKELQPSRLHRSLLGRFVTPFSMVDGVDIKGPKRFLFLFALVDHPLDALKLLWQGVAPDRTWLTLRYGLQDAPKWRVFLQRLWHPLSIALHKEI